MTNTKNSKIKFILMITLFTTCKPFKGEFELIQRNAITSWTQLDKDIEIIVFGDEYGVEEICNQLNIKNIRNIPKQYNLPVLREIFYIAQSIAKYDVLCYANADIIFAKGLLQTVTAVKKFFRTFLITGTRYNVRIDFKLDFKNNWNDSLVKLTQQKGSLHTSNRAFDYFVFSKGIFYNLPPFIIGRVGWDNHFYSKILIKRIPVFDATRSIVAIHQEHSYSNAPGGYKEVWEGEGSKYNISFLKDTDIQHSTYDAQFLVISNNTNSYQIQPHFLGLKRFITRTMPAFKYFLRHITNY